MELFRYCPTSFGTSWPSCCHVPKWVYCSATRAKNPLPDTPRASEAVYTAQKSHAKTGCAQATATTANCKIFIELQGYEDAKGHPQIKTETNSGARKRARKRKD